MLRNRACRCCWETGALAGQAHPSAAGNTQVAGILADAIALITLPGTAAQVVPRSFAAMSANCLQPGDYNHAIGSIAYDADQKIGTHSFTMAIWY